MKKSNKITISIICIIIILALLASVFVAAFSPLYSDTLYNSYGNSNDNDAAGMPMTGYTTDSNYVTDEYVTEDYSAKEAPDMEAQQTTEPILPGTVTDGDIITTDRQVTKTGYISLYNDQPVQTYEQCLVWAEGKGGYEFSHDFGYDEQYEWVNAVIKVPVEELDAFLEYVTSLGEVQFSNVTTNDITATYIDTETRLKTMQSTIKSYEELLADTTNPQDKLLIIEQINYLTTQMEYLQAEMNSLNTQVEMATVNISIAMESDPNNVVTPPEWNGISGKTMLAQMKSGVVKTTNTIVNGFQRAIVIFVSLLPFIILLILVVIIVKIIIKRMLKPKKKQ